MLSVRNARTEAKRREAYRDLLKVARKTVGYGEAAVEMLGRAAGSAAAKLKDEVEEVVLWLWAVIDQTERRVLRGEAVPAGEKVVSLFETHTDIIVKDRRETHYGHKVTLAGGASGLILDVVIERGNPADSTRTEKILHLHRLFGHDRMMVQSSVGTMPHDRVLRSIELFASEVAPAVRRALA
jgi:transposase, IS5 family